MTNQYPQHYSDDMEYYPRPKSWFGKLLEFLVSCAVIFLSFAFLAITGYCWGVDYALDQLNETAITIPHKQPVLEEKRQTKEMVGFASYYDYVLDSGWSSKGHFVCAVRDFPRGKTVKVTNLDNDKTVNCKITDYGPDFAIFPERIIDLSSTAFTAIADLKLGEIPVNVELVD